MAKLCADFLLLGTQIVAGQVQLPDHTQLRQRVHASMEVLNKQAAGMGFTAADIEDTRYAIAAFLDEMVQFSSWSGKQQWAVRPLQVELFGEQLAGIKFFERLREVGGRTRDVLEVYYLCLTLGFRGQYHMGNAEELGHLIEAVRRQLVPRWRGRLSVHGTGEVDAAAGGRRFPFAALAVVFVLTALVVAGLLMFLLAGAKGDAIELLSTLGRG